MFGFDAVLLPAFGRRNHNWFGQDCGERHSGFVRRTFRIFAFVFGGLAVDSLAIAYRDPEIVGMNLAEREEPMSDAAVIDERGLQRRLDAGDFSEVDVAFYLSLCGRFEIKLFETVAAEHHNPGLFRVSGIDKHAFGHSGLTPERVPAAARKSAGGAIPCAGKPAAPGVVPSSKDWAMTDLVRRARIGFGFLLGASPGAAACAAASVLPIIRTGPQRCTGRGARRADGIFSRDPIYRGKRPTTTASSGSRGRGRGSPPPSGVFA